MNYEVELPFGWFAALFVAVFAITLALIALGIYYDPSGFRTPQARRIGLKALAGMGWLNLVFTVITLLLIVVWLIFFQGG